jgi:hypothetical protein
MPRVSIVTSAIANDLTLAETNIDRGDTVTEMTVTETTLTKKRFWPEAIAFNDGARLSPGGEPQAIPRHQTQ